MQTLPARERFERVVREVADPVRRYLWRRTDEATADDVLSETLLVLWRRVDDIPDDGATAWAMGIARLQLANADRAARRQHRLASRIATLDPPPVAAPPPPGGGDTDEAVRATLEAMRAGDAELLRLWAWEELAPREIATVLAISINAATVRLHRARKRFEALWRQTGHGDGHDAVKEGDRT